MTLHLTSCPGAIQPHLHPATTTTQRQYTMASSADLDHPQYATATTQGCSLGARNASETYPS